MISSLLILCTAPDLSLRVKLDQVQRFICTMEIDDAKEKVLVTSSLECRIQKILPGGGFVESRVFDRTRMKIGNEEIDVPTVKSLTAEVGADGTLRKLSGKRLSADEILMWSLVSIGRSATSSTPTWSSSSPVPGQSALKISQQMKHTTEGGTIELTAMANTDPTTTAVGSIWLNPTNGWTQKLDVVIRNAKTGKGGTLVTIHLKLDPV